MYIPVAQRFAKKPKKLKEVLTPLGKRAFFGDSLGKVSKLPRSTMETPTPSAETFLPKPPEKETFFTGLQEGFKGGLKATGKTLLDVSKSYYKEAVEPALVSVGRLIEDIEKGYQPTGDKIFSELDTKEKAKAFGKEFAAKIVQQPQIFVSGGIGAISNPIGYLQRFGWDETKPITEKLNEWEEALTDENPDVTTPFVSGAGSMAVYYLAGRAVGAPAFFAGVSPKIANLFGNSVMTILESSSEAGGVYQELRERGLSHEEAARQADIDFSINALLLGVTNRFDFTGQGQKALVAQIKRRFATSIREGLQEFIQQITGNITTYKKWDEGIKEALSVGGALGFLFGGDANPNINMDVNTQKEIKELIETAKKQEGFAKMPGKLKIKPEKINKITGETKKALSNYVFYNNRKGLTQDVVDFIDKLNIKPSENIVLYRDGVVDNTKIQSWSKDENIGENIVKKEFKPSDILIDLTDNRVVDLFDDISKESLLKYKKLENEVIVKPIVKEIIPKELKPLAQEVRKYKSAEEFVQEKEIKKEFQSLAKELEINPKNIPEIDLYMIGSAIRGGMRKITGGFMTGSDIDIYVHVKKTGDDVFDANLIEGYITKYIEKVGFNKIAPVDIHIEWKHPSKHPKVTEWKSLTDFYNQVVKEVEPEVETIDKISETELEAYKQAFAGVEKTEEFIGVLEDQYQAFRKLRLKKLDEIEDAEQLKKKMKAKPEKIDDILYSQEKTVDEIFDKFKTRLLNERLGRYKGDVVRKTKDFQGITDEMKDKVFSFHRPSRKLRSRAFSLLGNKDTTIDLFDYIFNGWAKTDVDTILEPYGGGFTLGTHALNDAIESGLKRFESNIFDKEKYLIIKAIQDGKIESVKQEVDNLVKKLNDDILKLSKKNKKVNQYFIEFLDLHPDSYIGSKEWYSFITNKKIGSDVPLYADLYEDFRAIFQDAVSGLYPETVDNLELAVARATIERMGQFASSNQGFLNNNGFKSIENKIYGKKGMIEGIEDIDKVFKFAAEKGTKIIITSEDGVDFLNDRQIDDPTKIGLYLDPPYIKSAKGTYEKKVDTSMEKFIDGDRYVKDHELAFNIADSGGRLALTNDIEQEYLEAIEDVSPSAKFFGYKENSTPTSLVVDNKTENNIYNFLKKKEKIGTQERAEIIRIKELQKEKNLSGAMMSRIKQSLGIEELKNASNELLSDFIDILDILPENEHIFTEKHRQALERLLDNEFKDERILTRSMVLSEFGGDEDIVHNIWIPVLYGKKHNRLIDGTKNLLWDASDKAKQQYIDHNEKFRIKIKQMRKDSGKGRNADKELFDKYGRIINEEQAQDLHPSQYEVWKYLEGYFYRVADTMTKGNKRFQYIPHIRRGLVEAWKNEGMVNAFKEMFKERIDPDIEPQIWANWEQIVANEKFSRFSLPRKGGAPYTTDLAKIMETYSKVYYLKKNFDPVLPIINALKPLGQWKHGTDFLNQYAQTLSGKPLDLKTPQVLKSIINKAVEYTYYRFLAFNYKAGFVNTAVGKMEQFIHQSIPNFIKGEKRFQTKRGQGVIKKYKIVDESIEQQIDALGNIKQLSQKILFFNMRGGGRVPWGENWIQGSQFLGEMTKKEYLLGKVSRKRYREIIEKIERAQGPYRTATRPMIGRTAYGRIFTQMKLWLFGKIADRTVRYKQNIKDIRYGQPLSEANKQTLKEIFLVSLLVLIYTDKKEKDRISLQGALTDFFSYLDFGNWTWVANSPAPAISSLADVLSMLDSIVSQDKYKTSGYWGEKGDVKWINKLIHLMPAKSVSEWLFIDRKKRKPSGKIKIKVPKIKLETQELNIPKLKINPSMIK